MTTDTANKPAFYIFVQQDGETRRIGAAFRHKKGNGFNLVINNQRYTAFPPRAKTAQAKAGGGEST